MIKAKILKHSKNIQGDEVITYELLFPRMILSELLTHREASRNTSSSRAIKFEKMVEAVQNNPFIPIAWQKHHKGMQGREYETNESELILNEQEWLGARDNAVEVAKILYEEGKVTKQLCNRLLEPFMWTRMIFTISKKGLENLFNLRCPRYKFDNGYGEPTFFFSKKEWKEVIRALAVALLSWGTVLFTIVYAIIILCRLIEEWYEDNKDKFGKPPKWL